MKKSQITVSAKLHVNSAKDIELAYNCVYL